MLLKLCALKKCLKCRTAYTSNFKLKDFISRFNHISVGMTLLGPTFLKICSTGPLLDSFSKIPRGTLHTAGLRLHPCQMCWLPPWCLFIPHIVLMRITWLAFQGSISVTVLCPIHACRVMMTYNLSLIWIKSRENEHTIKGLCFNVYSSLDNSQLI